MNYGIQLYSVRDITEKRLASALEALAKLGYQSVEFAGFFGHSADEVKTMLQANGLTVSGTHTGIAALKEQYAQTVAFHQAIGCDTIIIPWADVNDQAQIDSLIGDANDLQKRLAKDGIRLGYHNHAHEFKPIADGTVPYDALIEKTDLFLEIDTYWAYVAGQDPVAMMNRLHQRVPVIHIKDGSPAGEGKPLGMGQAPVKDVYETAKKLGIQMVVESETLTPDGLTEARICVEYLKGLEK